MATVTTYKDDGQFDRIISTRVPVADTWILDAELVGPHVFVGIVLYDSNGAVVDAATGGTFTVTAKTWNTERWEALTVGTLDATALATTSLRGTFSALRVVPSSVAGNDVTTYEVRVSAHKS